MRIRGFAVAFACSIGIAACGDASPSPTAAPSEQAHQNGLILGSGNRTADSTAAVDSEQTTGSAEGGVVFGSGN